MKRTKKPKIADAILTADLHLTNKQPISRTDDYIQAQENKLRFLWQLSRDNDNCPVLCAGDVFDFWKASPWLCTWAHCSLPQNVIAIPGNHDLPMHAMVEYDKSALFLLEVVGGKITVLKEEDSVQLGKMTVFGVPFGRMEHYTPPGGRKKKRQILLLHELIWPKKKPTWAGYSFSAEEVLDEFGEYFDLVVSGDNHQSFVVEGDDCVLVNPGSMMRSTADQLDFKPRCYLYYAEDNTVIPAYFPIEENVHTLEHLTSKKERDERISAYIERLSNNWEGGLSFQDNLQAFFNENNTPRKVRELIWQQLETKLT